MSHVFCRTETRKLAKHDVINIIDDVLHQIYRPTNEIYLCLAKVMGKIIVRIRRLFYNRFENARLRTDGRVWSPIPIQTQNYSKSQNLKWIL